MRRRNDPGFADPATHHWSGRALSLPVTFVRLKLRLVRNRARATRGGSFQLGASLLLGGLVVLIVAPLAFSAARSNDPRAARNAAVLGATLLVVGWAVFPLLSFGTDETVDPAKLVLFPLPRHPLMAGMVLSSLIGVAPVAVAIVTVAAAAGYARGAAAVLAAPVVVLLLLLLAVTTARTLSTALAATLTSRRGRDVTIVLAALLAISLQGVRFVRVDAVSVEAVDRVVGVLRWLPPGMLGQALTDAAAGRVGVAVLQLIPPAASVASLLVVWGRALERSMTVVVEGSTVGRRRRSPSIGLPLLFRRLPFLRPTPWGAVAAKELRYLNREPRRKVTAVNAVLIGITAPLFLAFSAGGVRPDSVLLASLAGYVVVLQSMNQFGFDRGALWMDAAAGDVVRAELMGKNLANAMLVAVPLVVAAVVLAGAGGGWAFLPAALLVAVAGLGAGLGIGNVVSVRWPIRMPESKSPFGGAGGGQGCATSAIVLGCSVLQNLVIAPVAVTTLIAVNLAPVSLVVVAPLCALYGGVLWWAGLSVATSYARRHQPELLQAVDPARSDAA